MHEEVVYSVDKISKLLKKEKPLDKDQQLELLQKYKKEKCLQAKQRLLAANIRLVFKIAYNYINKGIELEELFQEGIFGLNRAIEK